MHRQRQDAATQAVHFHAADDTTRSEPSCPVVELDAQGQLLIDGRWQPYSTLFNAEARAERRPEELLRLARRHGLVRDCVIRRDGDGIPRPQRIALSTRKRKKACSSAV